MKIQNQLDQLISGSPNLGTFPLPELLRIAGAGLVNGLAVAKNGEQAFYLAVLAGEPEGAVFADENGELYGDKAVVHLTGREQFRVSEVSPDLVNAVVMGCRIFEKSHIRQTMTTVIPEIGRKAEGIGVLTLTVKHEEKPQNGVRVSIRQDGRVMGSDVTTDDGSVRFRLAYGHYDCIVQDRSGNIFSSHITFDDSHAVLLLAV
nr:hypothetical protein [uncultured Methanoregula sp.]